MISHQVLKRTKSMNALSDYMENENIDVFKPPAPEDMAGYYNDGTNNAKCFEYTKSQLMRDINSTLTTTDQKLEAFASKERTALDLTLSFAKDVSLLALLGNDKEIEAIIQNKAVAKAVELIDERIYTRIYDNDGNRINVRANGFFQVFRHTSSREQDPLLHYHIILSNRVEHNNKLYALRAEKIIESKYYINAITNYITAYELQKQNYNAYFDKELNVRTLNDDRLIEHFSKRKQQIIEKAKEMFGTDKLESLTREQLKMLVLETRKGKEHNQIETLQQLWQAELADIGYTIEDFYAKSRKEYTEELTKEDLEKAFDIALSVLDDSKGVFKTEDLEIEFIKYVNVIAKESGKRFISYEELKSFFNEKINDLRLISIKSNIRGTTIEQEYLCTRDYYMMEQKALQTAKDLASTDKWLVSEAVAFRYIYEYEKSHGFELTEEQRKSVLNIASNKQLSIINGHAGAGKTTSAEVIGMIAKDFGYRIIALAPSGKASVELANSLKAEAQTIDSFILSKPELNSKTILFVDEAGMADTRQLNHILSVAKEYGCKVVLQGDFKQLKPVQAGDLYTDLYNFAKSSNSDILTELRTIRRQKREDYKSLTTALSEFAFTDAFTIYAKLQNDYFKPFNIDEVKKDFLKDFQNTIIVSTNNQKKDILNEEIRKELVAQNVITNQREFTLTQKINSLEDAKTNDILIINNKRYRILSVSNMTFTLIDEKNNKIQMKLSDLKKGRVSIERQVKKQIGVGDRVVALKNDNKKNIKNGDIFEVVKIENNKITLKNETKKIVIDLDKYNYFDYAYTITTHKSQGLTIDRVLVMDDGKINYNLSYVGATRGKKELKIYTNDIVNYLFKSQFMDEKATTLNLQNQNQGNTNILSRDEIAKIVITSAPKLEIMESNYMQYSKYIDNLNERKQIKQQIEELKQKIQKEKEELSKDIKEFEKEQKVEYQVQIQEQAQEQQVKQQKQQVIYNNVFYLER